VATAIDEGEGDQTLELHRNLVGIATSKLRNLLSTLIE
jgi:hypothetical protein